MIVGISFVVFAFCIVMGIQMVQKNSNLKKLKEQESKLAQQYQQELQISENLKDKEQYVHTDEYLEEMARKLGLLYPDEVIKNVRRKKLKQDKRLNLKVKFL